MAILTNTLKHLYSIYMLNIYCNKIEREKYIFTFET